MFMDFREGWPPEPWEPKSPAPRITKRGESILAWVIGFNLLMLVFGPLAGASVIEAIIAVVHSWN